MLITDLNPKVLLDVYSYLDVCDSISLAETCVLLRGVAEMKYKEYKSFDLTLETDTRMDIRKVLSHIGPHISVLRVELRKFHNHLNLSKSIKKYCSNVKSLIVYKSYDSVYSKWIKKLKLESLTLDHVKYLKGNLGHGITTLRELIIDESFAFDDERIVTASYYILEQNPTIETLRIPLTEQFNYEIFAKLHKLRHLGIDVKQMNNLEKLIPFLQMNELTKFQISDWHHENRSIDGFNGFLKFLAENSRLEKLAIKLCNDSIVESTLQTLNVFELKSLIVTAPSGNDRRIETTIANVKPNLTHLHLGLYDQTLDRIMFLIKNLRKLETLHFVMSFEHVNQLLNEEWLSEILQTSNNRPNLQLHITCCNHQFEVIIVSLFFKACSHTISKRSLLDEKSRPSCCLYFQL